MATTTARLGLHKPALTDSPPNIATAVGPLADDLDAICTSATQLAAIAGTQGTPSGSNKFVTDADTRNSNARAPTAHGASHDIGGSDPLAVVPLGGIIPYAFDTLPAGGKFTWANGGLIDRTVNAAFFAGAQHKYNGDVDPGGNMVRVPDKRGRVSVGADNMASTGAAGRLPNTNRARGQNHGEERHTQTIGETPVHAHGVSDPTHAHGVADPTHAHGGYVTLPDFSMSIGGSGVGMLSDNPGAPYAYQPGLSIYGAYTGVGIYGAGTGIGIANNGSGQPHNVMQPGEVDNYIVRIA
jgi:microcystin-dependent protein